ncbi:MAG: hypothetical protein ACAH80_13875 [Alphaproteobacteria bacterium]
MMSFLKNFLQGGKSLEEKAIIAAQAEEKARDVLTIDAYAMAEDDGEEETECYSAPCSGCACRG